MVLSFWLVDRINLAGLNAPFHACELRTQHPTVGFGLTHKVKFPTLRPQKATSYHLTDPQKATSYHLMYYKCIIIGYSALVGK